METRIYAAETVRYKTQFASTRFMEAGIYAAKTLFHKNAIRERVKRFGGGEFERRADRGRAG